jgi:hypothetical protein
MKKINIDEDEIITIMMWVIFILVDITCITIFIYIIKLLKLM